MSRHDQDAGREERSGRGRPAVSPVSPRRDGGRTRTMRALIAVLAGALLAARALFSGPVEPAPAAAPPPSRTCEGPTYDGRGQGPQARREADLAREKCEQQGALRAPAEREVEACAGDEDRRNAPPPAGRSAVAVYFSCKADIASKRHPVYRFTREVSTEADLAERLEEALLAYLEGPSEEQRKRGYLTALPTPLTGALEGVSIEDGVANVSFSKTLAESLAGSGGSTRSLVLLDELRATVFQFERIRRLQLQLGGDCRAFFRTLEMSCEAIERTHAQTGR